MRLGPIARTLMVAAFTGAVSAGAADAKPFRYALSAPILTLDPHSSSDFATQMVLSNVYDSLVERDQNLELQPGLATSWTLREPTVWRFTLRQGVKFHEGQPFTADDVKFSLERAAPSGMFTQYLGGIAAVTVVDPATVDVTTKAPDPLLPRWLTQILIMNKDWTTANNSAKATNLAAKEEQYVVRHANGTNLFKLQAWDTGSGRVTMVRNDGFWGRAAGNVTEAVYTPIGSAPTRVAALLSGELDLVADLPIQDIDRVKADAELKVQQKPEFRMVQIEMSPFREVATDTFDNDGKPLAKNPWRDLRVRQAVAHALNLQQIVERVMRGFAYPAGIPSTKGLAGYQEDLDQPYSYDPDLSKRLLAEAGYPDGFRVRLQCTNDRYVNDEAICRAVAGMLARVGIKADADVQPWQKFVQDLINTRIDFGLVGAAANGQDTFDLLQGTWMTKSGVNGFYNWSRWSDPEFDTAVEALKSEFDPAKRRELYRKALSVAHDHVAAAWLHSQVISWGMKKTVDATIRQDSYVMLAAVTVN